MKKHFKLFFSKIVLFQSTSFLILGVLFITTSALLPISIKNQISHLPSQTKFIILFVIFFIGVIASLLLTMFLFYLYYVKKITRAKFYIPTEQSKKHHQEQQKFYSLLFRMFNKIYLDKFEFISILNSIQEGILVLTENDLVLYYNQSFHNQFSFVKKPQGKNIYKVISDGNLIEFLQSLKLTNKKHLSLELVIANKLYLLNTSIINEHSIYIIVFHDISVGKQLEKIKKDFIANASHELRTPLTSIKGYIELLEQNPKQRKEYIDIISKNTDRIINIINDLLKLSNLEQYQVTLNYQKCNLNKIVEEVTTLLHKKIENQQIHLKIDMPKTPIILDADKLKIEDVLLNLLDNAIKYSNKGGKISVICVNTKSEVYITINDTGIGIPEKYHTRIFERFFVVDKARSRMTEGTGLGLSIVKHIITLHKGTLELKSKENEGTEFTIRLPLTLT